MATITVSADTNWQDIATATGTGDTYNLNGGTLTIDTDSRYCTNHTATSGEIGTITFTATAVAGLTIDGTKVRIIPYDTGSGNVPAIGTTITEGGVSAYLLGVWQDFTHAPTAAGAAMPASGWIKVKNKTGGNYSAAMGNLIVGDLSTGNVLSDNSNAQPYTFDFFAVGDQIVA